MVFFKTFFSTHQTLFVLQSHPCTLHQPDIVLTVTRVTLSVHTQSSRFLKHNVTIMSIQLYVQHPFDKNYNYIINIIIIEKFSGKIQRMILLFAIIFQRDEQRFIYLAYRVNKFNIPY